MKESKINIVLRKIYWDKEKDGIKKRKNNWEKDLNERRKYEKLLPSIKRSRNVRKRGTNLRRDKKNREEISKKKIEKKMYSE